MDIKLTLEPNEHGKHIYHPGHVLKGMATLTLTRTKKFKGIYIKVYGRARTYWTSQSRSIFKYKPENIQEHVYESLEEYVDTKIYLVGPKDGSTFELQPGTHKYNFSYQLPENIPSTISLKYGNIAYFVEVLPDISWMFSKQIKIAFGVVRCDDLKIYRYLRDPVKIVEKKIFPTTSSDSNNLNNLHMTVSLPYSGFVANQNISMTILYENKSDIDVLGTLVTFNQKVEFRSSTIPQLKVEEYKLVEVHAVGTEANNSKSIPISFKIPKVPTSNRKFCTIITVSYFIEVIGDLGSDYGIIKVKIPITLGDKPIRSDEARSDETSSAVQPSAPSLELLSGLTQDFLAVLPLVPQLENFTNDLPPTYDEAMKMIGDNLRRT